jgi:hypothetical protein
LKECREVGVDSNIDNQSKKIQYKMNKHSISELFGTMQEYLK